MSLPTVGTITLEMPDESIVTLAPANARPAPVDADRDLYRPPFSTTWHVDGDNLRGVESLLITLEVWDAGGIEDAMPAVAQAIADLAAAAVIRTPFGIFQPRGILGTSRSPTELGYRFDVLVATRGWRANADQVLRFISGPVWELR